MKWSLAILIGLVLLWGAQTVYYYPQLPPKVAMSFKGSGHPNSLGSKEKSIFISAAAVGIILFSTALLPCVLIRYMPDKRINLPHRDYWLSAERREETKRYIQTMMIWFGAATMGFFLAVFEMVHRANLRDPVQLSNSFPLLIGGFIVFTMIWLILFAAKFYRVKNKAGL